MAQFIIENKELAKKDERDLMIIMGGEENNELWIKEKEGITTEIEFIGKFETSEIAYYIAKEIQAETSIEARVEGKFPSDGFQNKYLFKNDVQQEIRVGEYVIAFNTMPSNVLYRGYKTIEEAEEEIAEETPLKMYNDWLDWVASDYIAEKIEYYYIGKVVDETKNMYIVEYTKKIV